MFAKKIHEYNLFSLLLLFSTLAYNCSAAKILASIHQMNTWMPCYMMFSFSLVERKIHLETESNSIFLRVYPSKSQCPH
jgi:hypothetical protein